MDDLLVQCLEEWLDVVHSCCNHLAIAARLDHAHLDVLDRLEGFVDLLDAVFLLEGNTLMFRVSEDSLLHFVHVVEVCSKRVLYLATVNVDFVQKQKLRRYNNLSALPDPVLVLVRIKGIFVAHHEL